ncbi:MAG: hypothetical protein NTW15_20225 [Burkholderiales bacterium]|nr:hypothetical protein [Burkholderiales bacterium]
MRPMLPDLMQPRALPAAVPRCVALVGVIVACAGGLRFWQAEHRLGVALAEHEAATLLAAGRAPAAAAAAAASTTVGPRAPRARGERTAPTPIDATELERVALDRYLAVDWNRRLLLVEQAGAGLVSLTGLKVDAARNVLELRGETQSLERFETLRRRLLELGLDAVLLVRHETVQRAGGVRLDFVATAEWTQ